MAKKAKPVSTPTAAELKAVFRNSMMYEILFTFGVPEHHPADYCQWEFINFTRLAHARLLYLFFETPAAERKVPDDVVSEDFGFPHKPDLLRSDHRDRLNKDLLHFSFRRLRHTPLTKPWPPEILGNLLDPTLAFMRHINEKQPQLFDSPHERANWLIVGEILESGHELRVAGFTLSKNLAYVLSKGDKLEGGKPRFTLHYELTT